MSTTNKALAAYRSALRATKVAFNNDSFTLANARLKIRNDMKSEKSLIYPDFDINQRIELLEQISTFLKRNIVQGIKDKESSTDKYMLNIHDETELGDNDDLKKKKSTMSVGTTTGGCCGGGNIELKEKK